MAALYPRIMNKYFAKELGKELPVIIRVILGLLLAILGLFVSSMWFITGNPVLGILGPLMGLPCIFMGIAIVMGTNKSTSLSPVGLKIFGVILILVGVSGLYQDYYQSSLAWVFAAVCFQLAKNKRPETW